MGTAHDRVRGRAQDVAVDPDDEKVRGLLLGDPHEDVCRRAGNDARRNVPRDASREAIARATLLRASSRRTGP